MTQLPARLTTFVEGLERLVDAGLEPDEIIAKAAPMLRALVGADDWLPAAFAASDPDIYQQHLLYCDPAERFSIVSFVWGPGQFTPIHDHTVWGLVGVLRGAERVQRYAFDDGGIMSPSGPDYVVGPGEVDLLSPTEGDIHRVINACDDETSVSIHAYGGNIGRIRRSKFAEDGTRIEFVSSYSNDPQRQAPRGQA